MRHVNENYCRVTEDTLHLASHRIVQVKDESSFHKNACLASNMTVEKEWHLRHIIMQTQIHIFGLKPHNSSKIIPVRTLPNLQ